MFQTNNHQLEVISTLNEKYDLQSLTNSEKWKKNQTWKKISEDIYKETNIDKEGKQMSTKWKNKMNTLHSWEQRSCKMLSKN